MSKIESSLRSNEIIDEIQEESIFTKLRKRLSRYTIQNIPIGSKNTITVSVQKSSLGYSWTGKYNHATCIFAAYNGKDETDPWGKLDILLKRKVITQDQRWSFGEAIRNFDNEKGTETDLKNMTELASILGMEVRVD